MKKTHACSQGFILEDCAVLEEEVFYLVEGKSSTRNNAMK